MLHIQQSGSEDTTRDVCPVLLGGTAGGKMRFRSREQPLRGKRKEQLNIHYVWDTGVFHDELTYLILMTLLLNRLSSPLYI